MSAEVVAFSDVFDISVVLAQEISRLTGRRIPV